VTKSELDSLLIFAKFIIVEGDDLFIVLMCGGRVAATRRTNQNNLEVSAYAVCISYRYCFIDLTGTD